MFLLDTNIVSELRKPRPHGGVVSWYGQQSIDTLALPSVVVYELQAGANRTRQNDLEKAEEIEEWINLLLRDIVVLPFGSEEARTTANLMQKRTLNLLPDAMIAATATVYGLTVVTRNVRDFAPFSVRLLNPFGPVP